MDREQEEIQFLSFFGILKESYSVVSSWRTIFAQITAALIIPLSFIYLAHIQISELLFSQILHNEFILDMTPEGTGYYNRISDILSSEWATFFLFKIGYFIFFIILALLSTSAVVYTIACIYTAKDITFRNVMSVVPKVWKRLMVTFIWNFFIIFAYNMMSLFVFILGAITLGQIPILGVLFLILFLVSYSVGFFYITIIWHLATVVSVLEESYGLNAMAKSQNLIKGKMGVAIAIFFVVGPCFFAVQMMFNFMVVLGDNDGVASRVVFGILSLFLLSITMLFGLITQTIIYFVCKSYHHENIDKSSLSDHLGGYLESMSLSRRRMCSLSNLIFDHKSFLGTEALFSLFFLFHFFLLFFFSVFFIGKAMLFHDVSHRYPALMMLSILLAVVMYHCIVLSINI